METVQDWLEPIKRITPEASYEHSAIDAVYRITAEYMTQVEELRNDLEWVISKSALAAVAPASEKVTALQYWQKCVLIMDKYKIGLAKEN